MSHYDPLPALSDARRDIPPGFAEFYTKFIQSGFVSVGNIGGILRLAIAAWEAGGEFTRDEIYSAHDRLGGEE